VRPTRLRPETRRRGDIVAAALLVLLLIGGGTALWRTSAVARTSAEPAATPIVAPPAATAVTRGFAEAWRAPSAATPGPVVAGPAVVTGDGSAVVGRDAVTGAQGWSYTRDTPLCTVGAGFPGADDGIGRVLALYDGGTGYCSELTALRPDTGERVTSSNPDARPGARLLGDESFVVATGSDYLEVVRSDLVKTLEYGAVTTPVQLGRQPRTGCAYGSTVLATDRLGVVERCPGEPTDRLTVLAPDGADGADQPQEEFSVPLPASGATLVALSAERAAVALPNPPRLQLLDRAGQQVGLIPLDVPDDDLAADPPGGDVVVQAAARTAGGPDAGPERLYWWIGSRTVALDAADLGPLWTLVDTLGPALPYGGSLLVPVPEGLLQVDPASGAVLRTLPLARADPAAPVRLAAAGRMLLEQRGGELVALRPL
jgi:hypothetical protein